MTRVCLLLDWNENPHPQQTRLVTLWPNSRDAIFKKGLGANKVSQPYLHNILIFYKLLLIKSKFGVPHRHIWTEHHTCDEAGNDWLRPTFWLVPCVSFVYQIALLRSRGVDLGQEETVQTCMENRVWVEGLFDRFGELLTQVQQACL